MSESNGFPLFETNSTGRNLGRPMEAMASKARWIPKRANASRRFAAKNMKKAPHRRPMRRRTAGPHAGRAR